jgi:acetolactate decarboxylase
MNCLKQLTIVSAAVLFSACRTTGLNQITQTSTIDALLAGCYDGEMRLSELLTKGNTGLGTFNSLDGEMVVLNGSVYQIKSDGKVHRPPLSSCTPFACVTTFSPDASYTIDKAVNYNQLKAYLNQNAPNQNIFYSFIINGYFTYMKTRSVPGQKMPYPPLSEVAKKQVVFEQKDVRGTIVGFRCPAYVKGINVPGYHVHFLSEDKSFGGHILNFEMKNGQVMVDAATNFTLIVPAHGRFSSTNLTKDRSQELHQVESDKN